MKKIPRQKPSGAGILKSCGETKQIEQTLRSTFNELAWGNSLTDWGRC